MGQLISSIKREASEKRNPKKNSNSRKNGAEKYNIIDAYDERRELERIFGMDEDIEIEWKGQLRIESVELQAIDARQEKNPLAKEKHAKVSNNRCVNRDSGYHDVISHLKFVISTARGEEVPLKCYKPKYSMKSKGRNRRAGIQTTLL